MRRGVVVVVLGFLPVFGVGVGGLTPCWVVGSTLSLLPSGDVTKRRGNEMGGTRRFKRVQSAAVTEKIKKISY